MLSAVLGLQSWAHKDEESRQGGRNPIRGRQRAFLRGDWSEKPRLAESRRGKGFEKEGGKFDSS